MCFDFIKASCLSIFLCIFIHCAAIAKDLNATQLGLIRETASDICNTVREAKGQKTEAQIAGDVKAQLGGLAGKLANVGLDGKISARREAFEGLSQEAMGGMLQEDRTCRERLFSEMFAVVAREPSDKGQNRSDAPKTDGELPGPRTDRIVNSLMGEWVGSVVCKDGRSFLLTLTVEKQAGDTASGTAVWSGGTSGKASVRLAPSPNSQEPSSYVYVTDRWNAYSYNLKKISKNKFVGQSMGTTKCDIALER